MVIVAHRVQGLIDHFEYLFLLFIIEVAGRHLACVKVLACRLLFHMRRDCRHHLHGVLPGNLLQDSGLTSAIVWQIREANRRAAAIVFDDLRNCIVVKLLNHLGIQNTILVPVMEDVIGVTRSPVLLLVFWRLIIID